MHDRHEPEIRKARCDRVGVLDQDIGLNEVRGVRGIMTEAYTLQVAVDNVGVVKVLQSFDGARELKGAQLITKEYRICD